MPKVTATAAALIVLLALTGCASEDTGAGPSSSANESAEDSTARSDESPEPLVAETAEQSDDDASAQFLSYVRDNLRPDNVVPNATDAELVAAGTDGCEQIAAQVNPDDLTVIAGEERDGGGYYRDSSVIITGARMFLCPEFLEG